MPGVQQTAQAAPQSAGGSEALTLRLRETAAWGRIHGSLAPYLAALGGTSFPDDVPQVLADVLLGLSMDQPWAQAWAPAARWIARRASPRPGDADMVADLLAAVVLAFQRRDPKAAAPIFATLVKDRADGRAAPADGPQPERGGQAVRTVNDGAQNDMSAAQRVAAYQASPKWAQARGIIDPFLSKFEGNLPDKARWAMADVLSRLAANQPWNQAFRPTVDWINSLKQTRPAAVPQMVALLATVIGAARPEDRDAMARVEALFFEDQGRDAAPARTGVDTSVRRYAAKDS